MTSHQIVLLLLLALKLSIYPNIVSVYSNLESSRLRKRIMWVLSFSIVSDLVVAAALVYLTYKN